MSAAFRSWAETNSAPGSFTSTASAERSRRRCPQLCPRTCFRRIPTASCRLSANTIFRTPPSRSMGSRIRIPPRPQTRTGSTGGIQRPGTLLRMMRGTPIGRKTSKRSPACNGGSSACRSNRSGRMTRTKKSQSRAMAMSRSVSSRCKPIRGGRQILVSRRSRCRTSRPSGTPGGSRSLRIPTVSSMLPTSGTTTMWAKTCTSLRRR